MKFGVKSHYKDSDFLKPLRPAVIEIHTGTGDIANAQRILDAFREWGDRTIFHVPIYLDRPGGELQLVDLASQDKGVREESVGTVVECCRIAAQLGSRYIIIHPGGVMEEDCRSKIATTRHCFEEELMINELSMNLQFSLVEIAAEIDGFYSADKILLENMPHHFWLTDGRKWYPQLFLEARGSREFVDLCGGICLDICHAYLARPEGGYEVMEDFLYRLGKKIHHLHISDAKAADGEGLQIGEGEINFHRVARMLKEGTDYANLTAIPEIKEGHLKRGAGFHTALDRLRTIF